MPSKWGREQRSNWVILNHVDRGPLNHGAIPMLHLPMKCSRLRDPMPPPFPGFPWTLTRSEHPCGSLLLSVISFFSFVRQGALGLCNLYGINCFKSRHKNESNISVGNGQRFRMTRMQSIWSHKKTHRASTKWKTTSDCIRKLTHAGISSKHSYPLKTQHTDWFLSLPVTLASSSGKFCIPL